MKLKPMAVCLLALSLLSCNAEQDKPKEQQLSNNSTQAKASNIRPITQFIKGTDQACYDRKKQPSTAATDLHLHPEPFGGKSIKYDELMGYLENQGVRFVLLYGIGQTLPYNDECTYYLDCIGTIASPGMKNDFENAANYVDFPQEKIHVGLSMTFPDLANPESIVAGIKLLDKEYPKLFNWMGEVNLHKEALRGNGHEPADPEDIANWQPFMDLLKERSIPIAIHSDLGTDAEPKKNLALMEETLKLYPDNKIVWMHMGLSRELVTMPASEHIQLMSDFLDQNPNLYLDISWTVIAESYFDTDEKRALYVSFLNKYPNRILAGTDFVAAGKKGLKDYEKELQVTSSILADISDEAFRGIALGQTYFDIARGMSEKYQAPSICKG